MENNKHLKEITTEILKRANEIVKSDEFCGGGNCLYVTKEQADFFQKNYVDKEK